MDNRILHDPHLEVMPDHAGPHYDLLRNTLVQNGMTVEQTLQDPNDSWTQNHKAQTLAWDQQVADDALAAQNVAQGQQDQPQDPQDPPQPLAEEERVGSRGRKEEAQNERLRRRPFRQKLHRP